MTTHSALTIDQPESTAGARSARQFQPMTEMTMTGTHSASRTRKDSLGFRLIFASTFLIFLMAAVVDRLVPLRWIMGAAKSENYMAIFAEAKAAAATYTPFAFMG
jgi:hypothetical protein